MNDLKRAISLLNSRQKRSLLGLSFGVLLMALLEVMGVASIFPFIQLISEPDVIMSNPIFNRLVEMLGLKEHKDIVVFAGVGVLALILLNSIVSIVVNYEKNKRGWRLSHEISTKLLNTYLKKPYAYFLKVPSSEMSSIILTEVNSYITGVMLPFIDLVSRGLSVVIIFALLFYVNAVIATTMFFALGGLYAVIYFFQRRKMRQLGERRVALNIEMFKHLGEVLDGIKTVKSYNRQSFFFHHFFQSSAAYSKIQPAYQLIVVSPRYVIDFIAFGSIVGITLYLFLNGGDLQQTLPTLSLYAVAGYRLLPSLQNIFTALGGIRHYLASVDKLFPIISKIGEDVVFAREDEIEAMPFQTALDLRQVGFAYDEKADDVLKEINIRIKKGTTVAFVGSTGSGKTTLVDIVMGLLRPTRGQICIDGVALTEENTANWRTVTAYVPQDVFLFNDTIARNISMKTTLSEDEQKGVETAAARAELSEFINTLPEGYDTVVGQKGSRLSGGQRQRIGLARALYAQSELLILDEATSALDNITERNVVETLESLSMNITTIIIAHRLTSVKRADQIYVLENGKVSEQGTYDELMANGSTFHQMSLETEHD